MKLKGWVHFERSRGALLSLSLSLSLRKPLVFVITALLIFGVFLSTFVFTPTVKKAKAISTDRYVNCDTGNDTTGTGATGAPWKTMTKAESGSSDGDTVYVTGATCTTPLSVGGSTGTINFSKALTWTAQGTVTVTQASDTVGFNMAGNSNTITFNGFTFSSNNSAYGAIIAANGKNKIFNSCNFLTATNTVIRSNADTSLTFNSSTLTSTGSASGMIYATSTLLVFNNSTLNLTNENGITESSANTYSVTLNNGTTVNATNVGNIITSSAGDIIIDHCTIGGTFSGSAINSAYSAGLTNNVTLTDNDITIADTTGAGTSLLFAQKQAGNLTFSGNTVTGASSPGSIYQFGTMNGPNSSTFLAGNLDFSSNIITMNGGSRIPFFNYVYHTGTLAIDHNTITNNDATKSQVLFGINDPVNLNYSYNTTETYGTGAQVHLLVIPSVPGALSAGQGLVYIGHNIIRSRSTSGYHIQLGQDASSGSTYEDKFDGAIVEYNQVYGPAYFDPTITANFATHGILVGYQKGIQVRNNYIDGSGYGFVIKGNQNQDWNHEGGVYNNILKNNRYVQIYNKGCVNLDIFNNTIYFSSHTAVGGIQIGENTTDDKPATGSHLSNNIIYGLSGDPLIYVDVMSKTGFSSDYNNFYNTSGTNPNFHWGATDFTSLSDWQSASGGDNHSIFANPVFVSTSDFSLQSTSPAIDAGTNLGLVTDYTGNPIYGAPDIGAYEYQPPEVMGTNKIDIGAGARIYQDGSFRNLSTASGTSANLTITPQSGSFTVGNHALWMDIVIVVWNNTGIYHKSWTETSTVNGLNNTVHKVGDLAPNKYYNVKVDGVLGANMTGDYCTAGLCLADNNGIITFTYTGGYSTHAFDVESEPATVASSGSSNSSTPTTSSTPVAKFPETGIPPSHNNIPRNIFTLSGLLALVLTSIIVVSRKRRKII